MFQPFVPVLCIVSNTVYRTAFSCRGFRTVSESQSAGAIARKGGGKARMQKKSLLFSLKSNACPFQAYLIIHRYLHMQSDVYA